MIASFAFYLFAALLCLSAVFVVTARNPVNSVLFLILSFFSASGLLVLLGTEFIAMILVIVYVGAVAVLFLFVVMMLDVKFDPAKRDLKIYIPVGLLVGAVLLVQLYLVYTGSAIPVSNEGLTGATDLTNTQAIGHTLYTDYILGFQLAGLILLVAMMGAIVLTLRKRPDIHRQNVSAQNRRTRSETMEIQKVAPKTGI